MISKREKLLAMMRDEMTDMNGAEYVHEDNPPGLLDTILAELRIPDEAMIEAATRRTQGPDDSLYGTIFTAMIDSIRSGS